MFKRHGALGPSRPPAQSRKPRNFLKYSSHNHQTSQQTDSGFGLLRRRKRFGAELRKHTHARTHARARTVREDLTFFWKLAAPAMIKTLLNE
ncbi:hypothetical protein KOW79_004802 [Hemibagrus wyckioides]|uniref:Uncharacterized protein n=1 Tax=Hemibagrus wyckioides TaxID=337641 RepID=A0A9D3NXI4_9TELE|nr:hypothetical protein KOW79_004802 [Hemibagrus wyckioides]